MYTVLLYCTVDFMRNKILVIVGPTAVGKSDLAVDLAIRFNGEVISADSRQIYKGLDIGTGKITKKEMRGIPHHLLDIASSKRKFSVAEYVKEAESAIALIIARGKLPIVCGGAGFYIEALIDGIVLPDVPANDKLRKKLSKKSPEALLKILSKLDPKRAMAIDQKNSRRIIRAIEIAMKLGEVPRIKKFPDKFDPLFIGLSLSSEKLKERIAKRLDKRLADGMAKEVERLHKEGLTWKRMDELGLEYRYLALYLQKKMALEEMRKILTTEIWHYARRQMTWFRKNERIEWFEPISKKKIIQRVRNFLKRQRQDL